MWFAFAVFGLPADSLPPIEANHNHTPAGVLRGGVLTVQLEIAKGEWHPEADDGIALSVYAFGEAGRPLQNPGPLIRVPQGTEVRASLHNTLADKAKEVADLVATTDGIIYSFQFDGNVPNGKVVMAQAVGHRPLTAKEYERSKQEALAADAPR